MTSLPAPVAFLLLVSSPRVLWQNSFRALMHHQHPEPTIHAGVPRCCMCPMDLDEHVMACGLQADAIQDNFIALTVLWLIFLILPSSPWTPASPFHPFLIRQYLKNKTKTKQKKPILLIFIFSLNSCFPFTFPLSSSQ